MYGGARRNARTKIVQESITHGLISKDDNMGRAMWADMQPATKKCGKNSLI